MVDNAPFTSPHVNGRSNGRHIAGARGSLLSAGILRRKTTGSPIVPTGVAADERDTGHEGSRDCRPTFGVSGSSTISANAWRGPGTGGRQD